VVPGEFQEAVERAERDGANGPPMLALLGEEARLTDWAREGVRLVGRAQLRIANFKAARRSWEFIRKDLPDDIEAKLQLATIFERLGDLGSAPPRDRVIVATGHRADTPDRKSPRFPNTKESNDKAKAWLRERVAAERTETNGLVSGIGGAASGTDLIFLEVCAELGITTTVVLPIPREDYCRDSVADGGPDWVERFNRLVNAKPPVLLSDDAELPAWATSIPDYGVFQRGNIFMIEAALIAPNADVTLLALWNGNAGDGPGGTADMVKLAQEQGAKVCVKDTDALFGLAKKSQ
jgi:hypothetical protein